MTITDEDIKKLIETDIDDLTSYINIGLMIVNQDLRGKNLDEDRLELIQKFLAAHFICLRDRELAAQSFGDSSETYTNPPVKGGLSETRYGRQAIGLDTSGTLAKENRYRATFNIL